MTTSNNKPVGRPRGVPKGRMILPGLRLRRELSRMSRADLIEHLRAQHVPVSYSTLAAWEREEVSVPVYAVQMLAIVLNCGEADLLAVPPNELRGAM